MVISTRHDDHLESFQQLIITEAYRHQAESPGVIRSAGDLARWILDHRRDEVLGVLSCIVESALERDQDSRRIQAMFAATEVPAVFPETLLRMSKVLGVPQCHLSQQPGFRFEQCMDAVSLIHTLRMEVARADLESWALLEERLWPIIMEGNLEMTVGEAEEILRERTEETIQGLEDTAADGSEDPH